MTFKPSTWLTWAIIVFLVALAMTDDFKVEKEAEVAYCQNIKNGLYGNFRELDCKRILEDADTEY